MRKEAFALVILMLVSVTFAFGTATIAKTFIEEKLEEPKFVTENITCGSIIMSDTVLENNLDCTDHGLIIGADNVTLDCAGHSISGPSLFGINGVVAQGKNGVTIRNCVISDFYDAISLTDSSFLNIENNTLTNNSYGVFARYVDFSTITSNRLNYDTYTGAVLSRSDNNTVSGNTAQYNGHGFEIFESLGNNISNNTALHNDHGIFTYFSFENSIHANLVRYGEYAGLHMDASSNNSITSNYMENIFGYGIEIFNGKDNVVTSNLVRYCLYALSDSNGINENITGNNLSTNGAGTAMVVYLTNSTVEGNHIGLSSWGANIGGQNLFIKENEFVGIDYEALTLSADESKISGNVFEDNYGICLKLVGASGNLIWGNVFMKSQDATESSAYEDGDSSYNNWNTTDVGNFWSDFGSNPEYPHVYIIPGPGNGVDYHPTWNGPMLPVLSPFPNLTVNEYGFARIVANAYDPNNDALSYSINSTLFTQTNNTFTWRTGPTSSGEYDFLVTVSDGIFSDSESVHVTVRNTCKIFNKKLWCWDCRCPVVIEAVQAGVLEK